MAQPARILVVDDEQNIRLTLNALLGRAGHAVTTASSGEEAVKLFTQQHFDLMLVDLQMPGMNGIEVVEALRTHNQDTTVIILTGHGSLETAIEGIHQGVFDYLLKTTDPAQIVGRVEAGLEERAQQKRQNELISTIGAAVQELTGSAGASAETAQGSGAPVSERQIAIGPLQLDTWHQTAMFQGRSLNLTPTEFRLLLCLAEHAGQMLSYTQLVRCAQGYDTSELEAGELIKPHIHHLRQKIEPEPGSPRYLLNVRGKGYILQIEQ